MLVPRITVMRIKQELASTKLSAVMQRFAVRPHASEGQGPFQQIERTSAGVLIAAFLLDPCTQIFGQQGTHTHALARSQSARGLKYLLIQCQGDVAFHVSWTVLRFTYFT